MDRRMLMFMISMSLAFLAINTYFSPDYSSATTQQGQKSTKEALYLKEGSSFFSTATVFSDTYLVVTEQKQIPKQLFLKSGAAVAFQNSATLNHQTILIYGNGSIPALSLDSEGIFPLEILQEIPQTAYLYNNTLHFTGEVPKTAVMVAKDSKGALLLAGFYDGERWIPAATLLNNLSYTTLPTLSNLPYLIQNSTLQMVFSPIDGSLIEVNLPFESTSKESIVKPISTDRILLKQDPNNALFPLFPSRTMQNGQETIVFPKAGGFYPLMRRSLVENGQFPAIASLRGGFSIHLSKEEQPLSFSLKSRGEDYILFEYRGSGRRLENRFTLPQNKDLPYCFNFSIQGQGDLRDLWLNEVPLEVELISGSYDPILEMVQIKKDKPSLEKISLPKQAPSLYTSTQPYWIGNSNGFFTLIGQPLAPYGTQGFKASLIPGQNAPSRLTLVDKSHDRYAAKDYPAYLLSFGLKEQQPLEANFRFYAGPIDQTLLKSLDKTITQSTGQNPAFEEASSHFGFFSFISEPFSKFLFWVMQALHFITHSWGFSIILLTLVLRILLYPLNSWSMKATMRAQSVGPELKILQERYKKDPKMLQIKTFELYKEKKINPFSGCLPLLVQMPFLIGMFDLLKTHFQLRGASFIPGWIPDLTAPDTLFSWSYPLPFLGSELHLLPILLGGLMFLQQKMGGLLQKGPKAPVTDEQRQQQAMGSIMSVVFTLMFYHFPSGLNIYWIFSTLFGVVQQVFVAKFHPTNKQTPSVTIIPARKESHRK